MAVKDKLVPEDFINILMRKIRGFKGLSPKHQSDMAWYIWMHGTWLRKHSNPNWGEYMTIGYKELEESFGREGFSNINGALQIFEVTPNWHKSESQSRGYKLMPDIQQIKDDYLKPRKQSLTRLIAKGMALKTMPRAIDSKDVNGVTATAWKNAKILNKTPVNMENLKNLYSHMLHLEGPTPDMYANPTQAEAHRIRAAAGQLYKSASVDISGKNFVMHRYAESCSGRLYAKNVNLQNGPRLIRQAALEGFYDYDFENCHYTILHQLAERYQAEVPTIKNYLANKSQVREQIGQEVGIDVDQVKMCLLAIMYGAGIVEHRTKDAIPHAIGKEAAKRLRFNPLFSGIREDIKKARGVILSRWPSTSRSTTLVNAMGKRIKKTKNSKQRLAHLLQGIEAQALRAVIEMMEDNVILLLHDGFVTKAQQDIKAMERRVKEVTGFDMSISGQVITLPADLNFPKLDFPKV
jgi:hypothetical protein